MTQETQIETSSTLAEMLGVDEAVASALKNSIFPGAKDESIALAWHYCKARKLDIMKKPCHIVGMSVNGKWRDVIMPGIAEPRTTAMRTGKYMGQSEAEFGPMVELQIGKQKHKVPEWCKVIVYRLENGEKVPFPHTEWFEESCATKKEGDLNSMWTTRKRGQLAKCAEAGALRKAFPEELGGEMTAEEMHGRELAQDFNDMKPAEPDDFIRKNLTDPFQAGPETPEQKETPVSDPDVINADTLDKINQAWKVLGKSSLDKVAALKYVGARCDDFANLPQEKGEKLLKELQGQMNKQAGKTQGQIEAEKAAKAAKKSTQEGLI